MIELLFSLMSLTEASLPYHQDLLCEGCSHLWRPKHKTEGQHITETLQWVSGHLNGWLSQCFSSPQMSAQDEFDYLNENSVQQILIAIPCYFKLEGEFASLVGNLGSQDAIGRGSLLQFQIQANAYWKWGLCTVKEAVCLNQEAPLSQNVMIPWLFIRFWNIFQCPKPTEFTLLLDQLLYLQDILRHLREPRNCFLSYQLL